MDPQPPAIASAQPNLNLSPTFAQHLALCSSLLAALTLASPFSPLLSPESTEMAKETLWGAQGFKSRSTTGVSGPETDPGSGPGPAANSTAQAAHSEAARMLHGLLTPQTSFNFIEGHSGKATSSLSVTRSCVSVGVQVDVADVVDNGEGISTVSKPTPPSPVSPPRSTPKRKRTEDLSKPAYIIEGERLARGVEDELRFCRREKRRLRCRIASVERHKSELESLLIRSPDGNDETAVETDVETEPELDSDDAPEHNTNRFPLKNTVKSTATPLTPASSEQDLKGKARALSKKPSKSSVVDTLGGALTGRNPGYTFGEGSSKASSILTPGNDALDLEFERPVVPDQSTYLVFLDLETTEASRQAKDAKIFEVALCVTDKNYTKLDKGVSYLVHWPLNRKEIEDTLPENILQMHTKSGLLEDYESTPPEQRLTLAQVERRICRYLEKHGIHKDGRAVMAGAGVAYDRGMVRQHMPELNKYFIHQIMDTTSLWHAVKRKYDRARRFQDGKLCAHRAMHDIMDSIDEAKMYTELVLKSPSDVVWPFR